MCIRDSVRPARLIRRIAVSPGSTLFKTALNSSTEETSVRLIWSITSPALNPVSYTHLDVYKRQARTIPPGVCKMRSIGMFLLVK